MNQAIVHCPLGTECNKGPDRGVWETDDIDFNDAKELLEGHVKFSHWQVATGMAHAAQLKAEKLNRP